MAFDTRIIVRQFEARVVDNPLKDRGLVEQWILWGEVLEQVAEASPFETTVTEIDPRDPELTVDRLEQYVTLTYSKTWRVRWEAALARALRRTFTVEDVGEGSEPRTRTFDAPIFVIENATGEGVEIHDVRAIIEEPELGRRRYLRLLTASGRDVIAD